MSKYFKEETKKYKLSEYLKIDNSEFERTIINNDYRIQRTEYFIELLGDISLDKETYILFTKSFQCYGGRYDVRTNPETFKAMYEIYIRYPDLSADALEEIWFVYIKDLFDAYFLTDMLEKYIEIHGKTDDAIEAYIAFVNIKADEFQIQFTKEAEELESYKEEYGKNLVEHLQGLIKRQHIQLEDVKKSLPSSELINKDREHLNQIAYATRIFMGMCIPISYQMIESLATKEGLDRYPEKPAYVINGSREIATTFTKQEFLDSIKKVNDENKKLTKTQGSEDYVG